MNPANHPTLDQVVSCLSGYDPDALPVAQAQQIIRNFVLPLQAVEKVAIRSALDRVLAADIISPINVPAHDNSAMDGFAFSGAELAGDAPLSLSVVGTSYAGRAYEGPVGVGECVRIMTGAVMPEGCDTVVPQEFTSQSDTSTVMLPPNVVRPGDNRRLAGEDLAAGQPALARGKILRPADLGLLASLGVAEVPVQRRLRVAFFSTGDELRSIGQPLDEGCV
ncbi:MAG: molybdopterin molybdotransferase MoeA, partial [Burkholderiaceae bacterium]